jgi:hypothetical protein
MAAQIYTLTNFSTDTTAIIRYFTIDTNLSQQQHFLNLTGWLPPFDTYTAFTGPTTVQSQTKTYQDGTFDIQAVTTATTPTTSTTIFVNSNADIGNGWAVEADGIAPGTTVSSTPGTNRVVISNFPTDPIPSGEQINFKPPEYLVELNNTTGLQVGWTLSGNGFGSGSISILDIRPAGIIEISANPSGTPIPGNSVTFTSDGDTMLTIAPLSSATFSMDYTRVTAVYGTYASLVSIGAELDRSVVLPISNFMLVSAAPVADPVSPFWDGGGGGGDVGSPCSDSSSVSCSAECFTADTLVTMADGSKKRIADINEGDIVQGLNGPNRVLKLLTFVVGTNKLHGFNGKKPFVTSCHPIKTSSGWGAFDPDYLERHWPEDWKMLCEENGGPVVKINEETFIGLWKNGSMVFEQICDHKFIEMAEDYKVYNLTLDNDHTFIAEDVVVHNKGGECFKQGTLISMADGTLKNIEDVQVGERVLSANGERINTVMYVEHSLKYGTSYQTFYAPKGIRPFATENHPIVVNGKWTSANATLSQKLYPWIDTEQLEEFDTEPTNNQVVWNLWVDGDHTYQVNGFGTNSLVDDGGWLRVAVGKGYVTKDQATEITHAVSNSSSVVAYGSLLLSNLVAYLDWEWLTKYGAEVMLGRRSKAIIQGLIVLLGSAAIMIKEIKKFTRRR